MTQFLEVTRRNHVLEVRLNKPKVNAIDHAMSRALGEAFADLRDDPDLRVAILTAEGDRIFSAGWAGSSPANSSLRKCGVPATTEI